MLSWTSHANLQYRRRRRCIGLPWSARGVPAIVGLPMVCSIGRKRTRDRIARAAGSVVFPLLAGCSPTGGIPIDPGICPINSSGRTLLEEFVTEAVSDATFVALQSHDNERAFAISLLGVDHAYRGIASAVGPCTQEQTYAFTCDSTTRPPDDPPEPFWTTHDRCTQLRCTAADVVLATVYLTTAPVTDPSDRHTFEYDSESPPGHIVYDINPLITWRVDQSDPQRTVISAELVGGILFTPRPDVSEQPVDGADLTYSGEIRFETRGGDIDSGVIDVIFPSLGYFGKTIRVELAAAANGSVTGSVMADEDLLATITSPADDALTFSWTELCSP